MSLPAIDPIIPQLSKQVPVGREWRYELKLDGFRGLLHIEKGQAYFRSKMKRAMPRFQHLADQLARLLDVRSAIFDGEIVTMTNRLPDFYALMFRRGRPEYAAFDVMRDGYRGVPRPCAPARRASHLKELRDSGGLAAG